MCVEITDLFGKVVTHQMLQFDDFESHYYVSVSDLRTGIYFISLASANKILQRTKIIKE